MAGNHSLDEILQALRAVEETQGRLVAAVESLTRSAGTEVNAASILQPLAIVPDLGRIEDSLDKKPTPSPAAILEMGEPLSIVSDESALQAPVSTSSPPSRSGVTSRIILT